MLLFMLFDYYHRKEARGIISNSLISLVVQSLEALSDVDNDGDRG